MTLTPGRAPGAFRIVLDVLQAMASEPSKPPCALIVLDDEAQWEELGFYHVMPDVELTKMFTKTQALQRILKAEDDMVKLRGVLRTVSYGQGVSDEDELLGQSILGESLFNDLNEVLSNAGSA